MDNESDLTIAEIKAFIESNKDRPDVAEFIKGFEVEKELNTETVNAYLETPEGKVLLQPRLDRYATIAIKSHDEKQAPVVEAKIKAGVNEGIRKLHPEETEEQKQIREMREDMERMKKEGEAKELRNAILMEANNRKIPLEFVENIPYPSLEHFKNSATIFEKLQNDIKTRAINEFVAANAPKPGSGSETKGKIDLSKLSDKEILAMEVSGELDKLLTGN